MGDDLFSSFAWNKSPQLFPTITDHTTLNLGASLGGNEVGNEAPSVGIGLSPIIGPVFPQYPLLSLSRNSKTMLMASGLSTDITTTDSKPPAKVPEDLPLIKEEPDGSAFNPSPSVDDQRIKAYAKLEFPAFDIYIQKLSVVVGRRANQTNGDTKETKEQADSQTDIDLGPIRAVSRQHARVYYDYTLCGWALEVLGRNGVVVEGKWKAKTEIEPLGKRTKIQIAQHIFYFVLPSTIAEPEGHGNDISDHEGMSNVEGDRANDSEDHSMHSSSSLSSISSGSARGLRRPPISKPPKGLPLMRTKNMLVNTPKPTSDHEGLSRNKAGGKGKGYAAHKGKRLPSREVMDEDDDEGEGIDNYDYHNQHSLGDEDMEGDGDIEDSDQPSSEESDSPKRSAVSKRVSKAQSKTQSKSQAKSQAQPSKSSKTKEKEKPTKATKSGKPTKTSKKPAKKSVPTKQPKRNLQTKTDELGPHDLPGSATKQEDQSAPPLLAVKRGRGRPPKPTTTTKRKKKGETPVSTPKPASKAGTPIPSSLQNTTSKLNADFGAGSSSSTPGLDNDSKEPKLFDPLILPRTSLPTSTLAATESTAVSIATSNPSISIETNQFLVPSTAGSQPTPTPRPVVNTSNDIIVGPAPKPIQAPPNDRFTKPPYTYASLIAQAVMSTEAKKMTLNQIYEWITDRWPYFSDNQNGWQNSIRHNLTLSRGFIKIARRDNELGKGAFWAIEPSQLCNFDGLHFRKKISKPVSSLSGTSSFSRPGAVGVGGKPLMRPGLNGKGTAGSLNKARPASLNTPLPIIVAPVPPTYIRPTPPPSSTPPDALTALLLKDPPIVHHEKKLILNPSIFSNLTKENLNSLQLLPASQALSILQAYVVQHFKELMKKGKLDLAGIGKAAPAGGVGPLATAEAGPSSTATTSTTSITPTPSTLGIPSMESTGFLGGSSQLDSLTTPTNPQKRPLELDRPESEAKVPRTE